MSLRHIILGLLKSEGELSGYDIKQLIEDGINMFWYADLSQIYRALSDLEAAEWVLSTPDPDNNRQRKVYHITPTGDVALQDWLTSDIKLKQFRRSDLARLFFGRLAPPDRLREQVVALRTEYEQRLAAIRGAQQYILEQDMAKYPQDAPYWLITVDQGIRVLQAQIDWCNATLQTLDQLNNHSPDEET
ncbi:MAG: PadR family transcriptional regulator [Anaerolineales bacterium]